MAAPAPSWKFTGAYFENCNCAVVCPCLFSTQAPFTAQPTEGACEVAFGFHIDQGSYGAARLDGLNVGVILRTPGPMAEGNGDAALYIDERADDAQRAALQAIFSGQAGGVMGVLAPLIGNVLGVKTTPIVWTSDGHRRALEIPNIMHLAVKAVPSVMGEDKEIVAAKADPMVPEPTLRPALGQCSPSIDWRWVDRGGHVGFPPDLDLGVRGERGLEQQILEWFARAP